MTGLYAPLIASPILTAGRNGSGAATGHDYKYVLDNDADTYFTPSTTADSAIYIDLGSALSVDAVVMRLHNYNETYLSPKQWKISYSLNDSTYTQISLQSFQTQRTLRVPVIVDPLSVSTTARYWKIEFLGFANAPTGIKPEISCIWFMTNYSLPYQPQIAESNNENCFTYISTLRSGQQNAYPLGIGVQRRVMRSFIFTKQAAHWSNLYNAYLAARGSNRFIVIQSEKDSTVYYPVRFGSALSENRIDELTYQPSLQLIEQGFLRVPLTNQRLYPTNSTVGCWNFKVASTTGGQFNNGIAYDESIKGNNPSIVVRACPYTPSPRDMETVSIIDLSSNGSDAPYLYLAPASANDFEMGLNSFTVEAWVRGVTDLYIAEKHSGSNRGWTTRVVSGKVQAWIRDNDGNQVTATGNITVAGATVDDANTQWHYITVVFNRSDHTTKIYVDGSLDTSTSIASVTATLLNTDRPFTIGDYVGVGSLQRLYDAVCVTVRALSATEIANRYVGHADYGSWGM